MNQLERPPKSQLAESLDAWLSATKNIIAFNLIQAISGRQESQPQKTMEESAQGVLQMIIDEAHKRPGVPESLSEQLQYFKTRKLTEDNQETTAIVALRGSLGLGAGDFRNQDSTPNYPQIQSVLKRHFLQLSNIDRAIFSDEASTRAMLHQLGILLLEMED